MFLEENVITRTARATETTEFLRQEAARLREQMSATEKKVADFKQEHSNELPEHLQLRITMLESSKSRGLALEREIMDLEQEIRFLETQLVTRDATLPAVSATDRALLTPVQQLAALKAELTEKSAIYAPAHPDLKWLKRRIQKMEKLAAASTAGKQDPTAASTDQAKALLETQIDSAKARLVSLRDEKMVLQKESDQLHARIMETPQIERELKDLTRDYETAKAEYDTMREKQRDAELAESLEVQQKAERFVLLESPQVPNVPVWPNMRKAYAMGFALSIGSGAGIGLLAEFLDKSIRGAEMLTSILQHPPLVAVPYIENSVDRRRDRVHRLMFLLALLFLLIAALVITHFFIEPLGVFADSMLGETALL